MVSTPRCGRGDPGSIPGCGKFKINLIAHTFVAMGYFAPIAQSVLLVLSNGDDSRAHA